MTPRQVAIVKSTWGTVSRNPNHVAAMFYSRLFELNPKLRKLFVSDMTEQGRKLMQMLAVAVGSLDRLDEIVPAFEQLGRRHVDYKVAEEDYDTVGAALLWTLQEGLGDKFTPDAADAWGKTYTTLAAVMKRAAASAAA